MREILFKAKRIDNGEWVEGYYIYHVKKTICPAGDSVRLEDEQHVIMCDGFSDWNMPRDTIYYDIDPTTICQYTGLTDKNSNKIWENDILRYSYDYENSPWLKAKGLTNENIKYSTGAVFWSVWRGAWAVCAKGKNRGCNQDVFTYSRNPNRTEVIGNIFDDPELLESGE